VKFDEQLSIVATLTTHLPGPKGFINADVVKKHVAPPSLGSKVKVFVCGRLRSHSEYIPLFTASPFI
jgi:hypothetical protein